MSLFFFFGPKPAREPATGREGGIFSCVITCPLRCGLRMRTSLLFSFRTQPSRRSTQPRILLPSPALPCAAPPLQHLDWIGLDCPAVEWRRWRSIRTPVPSRPLRFIGNAQLPFHSIPSSILRCFLFPLHTWYMHSTDTTVVSNRFRNPLTLFISK